MTKKVSFFRGCGWGRGAVEQGETPLECAHRELQEELGCIVDKMYPICIDTGVMPLNLSDGSMRYGFHIPIIPAWCCLPNWDRSLWATGNKQMLITGSVPPYWQFQIRGNTVSNHSKFIRLLKHFQPAENLVYFELVNIRNKYEITR